MALLSEATIIYTIKGFVKMTNARGVISFFKEMPKLSRQSNVQSAR